MKCSQVLFGAVTLGVIVLVYLTTSTNCATDLNKDYHNLTMGFRKPNDTLLFNMILAKENGTDFPVAYHYFQWPNKNETGIYSITRFEAVDRDKEGYVFINLGGPGYSYLELYLESELGVGFEFQITIYGFKKY